MELFEAVENIDLEKVRTLLRNGAGVNFSNGDGGESVLHVAAKTMGQNSTRVMELLIEHGANTRSLNWWKALPVQVAASANTLCFFKKIVKLSNFELDEEDFFGCSILTYVSCNDKHGPAIMKFIMKKIRCFDLILKKDPELQASPFFGNLQLASCNNMANLLHFGGDINTGNVLGYHAQITDRVPCSKTGRICPLRRVTMALEKLGYDLDPEVHKEIFHHEAKYNNLNINMQVIKNVIEVEVRTMRNVWIAPGLSLFGFLKSTVPKSVLVLRHADNQLLFRSRGFKRSFPYFGEIARTKFFKAQQRYDLILTIYHKLNPHINSEYPIILFKKICQFLSTKDLRWIKEQE